MFPPRWYSDKNPSANEVDTRDAGQSLHLERSLGVENGSQLQYSCLKNAMDREVWWATVHGVAKSQT